MTEQTEDNATEDSTTEDTQPQHGEPQHGEAQDGATDDIQPQASQPDGGEIADEVEFIAAERLIFFTDAVVAIAMTLLAFDLRIPDLTRVISNGAAIAALWGKPYRLGYLAFLISFVVIGNHWRAHHRLFRNVSRLDARIISLNMVWLLMIVIMPFATRVLSGTGAFGIRFGLYAVIQVIAMLTALLMSRHVRANALLRPGAPGSGTRYDDATLLTVATMFAISIPVAFVTQWAFAVWVATVPAARLISRLRQRC
jgi:uncharacterized membrane protein